MIWISVSKVLHPDPDLFKINSHPQHCRLKFFFFYRGENNKILSYCSGSGAAFFGLAPEPLPAPISAPHIENVAKWVNYLIF